MVILSRVSYWRQRREGHGMLELETEHLSERELGDLWIISGSVLGAGLLWAVEPASLGAVKAAWPVLVELCFGLSTAVRAAASQLEPGLHGAASSPAVLCSSRRAVLFAFAFIAGFLLCPHGTSQTLTLIKKVMSFGAWCQTLIKQRSGPSPSCPLFGLACFQGASRPGPPLATQHAGQCCGADHLSLLLFALPFVNSCFLALCTRGSQRLSWCDCVSGPPQQSCPGEDFLPVPFCAAGRAVMHFLGTRLMMLTWPP